MGEHVGRSAEGQNMHLQVMAHLKRSLGELERRCRGRDQRESLMPLLPGPVSGWDFLKEGHGLQCLA